MVFSRPSPTVTCNRKPKPWEAYPILYRETGYHHHQLTTRKKKTLGASRVRQFQDLSKHKFFDDLLTTTGWDRAKKRMLAFAQASQRMLAERGSRGAVLLALRRRLVMRSHLRRLLRGLALRGLVLNIVGRWQHGHLSRALGRWRWSMISEVARDAPCLARPGPVRPGTCPLPPCLPSAAVAGLRLTSCSVPVADARTRRDNK